MLHKDDRILKASASLTRSGFLSRLMLILGVLFKRDVHIMCLTQVFYIATIIRMCQSPTVAAEAKLRC